MKEEEGLVMKVATFRFGLIADFVTGTKLGYGEKERLLAEKAVRSYQIPGSSQTRVSRATLLGWIKAYQKGGNRIDALKPKTRSDYGSFKTLSTPVRMEIKRLKLENSYYTIPVIIKKLRLGKIIAHDERVNKATIYRFIRKECAPKSIDEGVDRRRFESNAPNDMWQCDMLHGPMVFVDGEKAQKKSYLLAIIDDHSRLIVYAQFHTSETFEVLKLGLREAISRRGIPHKFYVDNGACYRAEDLERILACLGVGLCHSRPYKPQGRGKIERWFKNIRSSFFPLLPKTALTIHKLNELLGEFVEEYNNTEHSSIGATPYQRYRKGLECIRPAPERLMDYFRVAEYRRVKKDRTVRLHGKIFEVSAKLIDQTVELLFHPDNPEDIEVKLQDQSFGKAVPIDLNLNYRVGRDWSKEEGNSEIHVSVIKTNDGGHLFGDRSSEVFP